MQRKQELTRLMTLHAAIKHQYLNFDFKHIIGTAIIDGKPGNTIGAAGPLGHLHIVSNMLWDKVWDVVWSGGSAVDFKYNGTLCSMNVSSEFFETNVCEYFGIVREEFNLLFGYRSGDNAFISVAPWNRDEIGFHSIVIDRYAFLHNLGLFINMKFQGFDQNYREFYKDFIKGRQNNVDKYNVTDVLMGPYGWN